MDHDSAAPPSRPALAAAAQDLSDAECAELDELLAAIPEPLQPLDAVMLDGYLCGVIVQPSLIAADDWLPFVFDAGGHRWGAAEPEPEQLRARALIVRRHTALNRSIAEFGAFDPFILEPLPTVQTREPAGGGAGSSDTAAPAPLDPIGDALLSWVAGFDQALQVFPGLDELGDERVAMALARLLRFLPEAEAESGQAVADVLARERPLATLDDAIAEVVACVAELYDITEPLRYKVEAVRRAAPKVGRNDPCPCGSGRKWKQCHGAPGAAP